MKRNLELIREILMDIESSKDLSWNALNNLYYKKWLTSELITSKDKTTELNHQIELLQSSQFFLTNLISIRRGIGTAVMSISASFHGLSNKGHEYIESIRQQEIWNSIKQDAINLSFDAIKQLSIELSKSYIKKKLGL